MKTFFFPFIAFILAFTLSHHLIAQSNGITDTWSGILNVQGQELGVVFHIKDENGSLTATMDSPDQNSFGLKTNEVSFSNNTLEIKSETLNMTYEGVYDVERDYFSGTFVQNGMTFELDLARGPYEPPVYDRPQTPKEPFAYTAEEVTFVNKKAKIKLAGTLTMPKEIANPPVAILITGSGPQNRDSELMQHKPFWVIADFLSTQGIAVLRYDERGVGESEGRFGSATSEDFASDVLAAVAFLKKRKDINRGRIFLIGHSEGGLIAPMVAAQSKDVRGIVLLAGPGVEGEQILLKQAEDIMAQEGMDEQEITKSLQVSQGCYKIIKETEEVNQTGAKLQEYLTEAVNELPETQLAAIGDNREAYVISQVMSLNSPWMRFFIKYDPAETLKQVKCPVLAVNGERDIQVDAEINLQAIQQALEEGENKNVKVVFYPELNHLFQHAETGAVSEYIKIEETFSQEVMVEILEWISIID